MHCPGISVAFSCQEKRAMHPFLSFQDKKPRGWGSIPLQRTCFSLQGCCQKGGTSPDIQDNWSIRMQHMCVWLQVVGFVLQLCNSILHRCNWGSSSRVHCSKSRQAACLPWHATYLTRIKATVWRCPYNSSLYSITDYVPWSGTLPRNAWAIN